MVLKPKAAPAAPAPPPGEESPVAPPRKPVQEASTSSHAGNFTPSAPECHVGQEGQERRGFGHEAQHLDHVIEQKDPPAVIKPLNRDKLEKVVGVICEGVPDLHQDVAVLTLNAPRAPCPASRRTRPKSHPAHYPRDPQETRP
ncbi:hypothetical protein FRC09_020764 [Ceratobasidium sp. 395]|nr:hypothetical protein FRC09_020764 [Ceratobasidium sp. 395]